MTDANRKIWDALYSSGNYLHFPSEVFVQLYFRLFKTIPIEGRFLDHGCGSGNNSEFLVDRGWSVTGSDISAKALDVVQQRLAKKGQDHEQLLLDGSQPLADQLNRYDHILAWDSLCYNNLAKTCADTKALAEALKPGGLLFVNMPTTQHDFATTAERLADGSYVNRRTGTRQEGSIMTIPDNLEQLRSWFGKLDIVEEGYFCFDFSGFREFMFVVLRKPHAT